MIVLFLSSKPIDEKFALVSQTPTEWPQQQVPNDPLSYHIHHTTTTPTTTTTNSQQPRDNNGFISSGGGAFGGGDGFIGGGGGGMSAAGGVGALNNMLDDAANTAFGISSYC